MKRPIKIFAIFFVICIIATAMWGMRPEERQGRVQSFQELQSIVELPTVSTRSPVEFHSYRDGLRVDVCFIHTSMSEAEFRRLTALLPITTHDADEDDRGSLAVFLKTWDLPPERFFVRGDGLRFGRASLASGRVAQLWYSPQSTELTLYLVRPPPP